MVIGKKVSVVFLVLILSALVFAAENETKELTNNSKVIDGVNKSTKLGKIVVSQKTVDDSCLYYFYGMGCLLCKETDSFIAGLTGKYPELKIKKYEIYYNKTNRQLLNNYFDVYGITQSQQGLPVVFMSKSYFLGAKAITNFLEGTIKSSSDSSCPDLSNKEVVGIVSKQKSPKNLIETISFSMIVSGAFENNLTPAALSILMVLMILFLGFKLRRKLIVGGLLFVVAVFVTKLLIGVQVILPIKYDIFSWLGWLGILVGLYGFKRKYWARKLFVIPEKIKKVVVKVVTNLGAIFIFGVLVSLFELTNKGIYKTLLELTADQVTKNAALPLLLFHNFFFILYLIVVVLIFGYSLKRKAAKKGKLDIPDGIENRVKTNISSLHFMVSLVIFILGIVLAFVI